MPPDHKDQQAHRDRKATMVPSVRPARKAPPDHRGQWDCPDRSELKAMSVHRVLRGHKGKPAREVRLAHRDRKVTPALLVRPARQAPQVRKVRLAHRDRKVTRVPLVRPAR